MLINTKTEKGKTYFQLSDTVNGKVVSSNWTTGDFWKARAYFKDMIEKMRSEN